jgi:hypothetical protein
MSAVLTGQLWSISTAVVQVRLRIQLNTILFAKTLVRKDIASSSNKPTSSTAASPRTSRPGTPAPTGAVAEGEPDAAVGEAADSKEDDNFSSKAAVMTLMQIDSDRVSEFAFHLFSLIGQFFSSVSPS